ncbi:MAG: response regulator [Hyphomicrobium sp.]
MAADILIVDDEADIRDLVAGILEDEGHSARLARDSDEALKAIEERRPHLVVLDIWLQGSRLDGPGGAVLHQAHLSRAARRHHLRPRQHRNPPSPPSSAALTTTSRSRSRPTASSSSRCAPSKPRS